MNEHLVVHLHKHKLTLLVHHISFEPTATPTKSPWSESAFVTFLYGDNTASDEGSGEESSGSSSSGGGSDEVLASEVNEGMENHDDLKFHFYCGYSWSHGEYYCD